MKQTHSNKNMSPVARGIVLAFAVMIVAQILGSSSPFAEAEAPKISAVIQAKLEVLREEIRAKKYKYTVGYNPAMEYSLAELCGLVEPLGWREKTLFMSVPVLQDLQVPASFDWKGQGGVTPVRNQGACGSCWAFATAGVLECLIKIQCDETVDLSEQYLVSCNEEGMGCGGGWFAHDYHEWWVPAGEPEAVAVSEASFPYVASDVACGGPYSHPWKLDNWAYIGDWWSVPSVAAIKQGIMDYGPVAVAVYVGAAFQAYNGGIFDNDECPGCAVNHAVVLVGWDDAQGTNGVWILRNSWGSGWGEDGYMRIEYGISKVGYAANYAEFSQCPPLDPGQQTKALPWLRPLLLEGE